MMSVDQDENDEKHSVLSREGDDFLRLSNVLEVMHTGAVSRNYSETVIVQAMLNETVRSILLMAQKQGLLPSTDEAIPDIIAQRRARLEKLFTEQVVAFENELTDLLQKSNEELTEIADWNSLTPLEEKALQFEEDEDAGNLVGNDVIYRVSSIDPDEDEGTVEISEVIH